MTERKLDFNQLEARGLFLVQDNVLKAAAAAAQSAKVLEVAEAEAAKLLEGRVPAGVTIRQLRIDQATSNVFAPEAPPAPPTAP